MILVHYMGHPINEVTSMVASLGEAKTRRMQKVGGQEGTGSQERQTPKGDVDPNVLDLVLTWVGRNKIDGKPHAYLLELWQ